jgi:hypothetical protein
MSQLNLPAVDAAHPGAPSCTYVANTCKFTMDLHTQIRTEYFASANISVISQSDTDPKKFSKLENKDFNFKSVYFFEK